MHRQARFSQMRHPGRQLMVVFMALLVAVLLLPAAPAYADPPSTRGKKATAMGGTERDGDMGGPSLQPTAVPHGLVEAPRTPWQGVQPLPPPGALRGPRPPQEPGQVTNIEIPVLSDAWEWATENLNPGNWVLNAGLGILTGALKGITGLLEGVSDSLIRSAAPTGAANSSSVCQDPVAIVMFCTPTNMTSANAGVHRLWSALRPIALCIVAILFVLSLGRLITKGQQTLMAEGKALILHFVAAIAFAALSPQIIAWMIDLANELNSLVLRNGAANGAIIFPGSGEFSLGVLLLHLAFWIVFIIAIFKSFWLTAQIMVLIAVSPVAGALLLDRSTAGRFNTWLSKLVDALLQKTAWAILFLLSSAIFSNFQATAAERGLAVAYSIIILLMILFGQNVLGIFSSSSSPMGFFGAYLSARGLMRMAGAAKKVGGAWLGRSSGTGDSGASPSTDPTPGDAPSGPDGGNTNGPLTSGDPTQSHYMQRHGFGGPRGMPRAPTLPTSTTAHPRNGLSGAQSRNGAGGHAPRPNPLRATPWRRTPRGLQPVTFEGNMELRARSAAIRDRFEEQIQHERSSAAELRGRGLDDAAQEREQRIMGLERKRDIHAQIARTGMVPEKRPPTPLEERERKQAIWRQARMETQGEIQAERETLPGRVRTLAAEEQRLTRLSAKVRTRAEEQATRQRNAGNAMTATELLQGGQQRIDRIDSARQAVQSELAQVRTRQAELTPTLSDDPTTPTKTTSIAARQQAAQKVRARQATQPPQRPSTPFTERFRGPQPEPDPAGQPAPSRTPPPSPATREQTHVFAERRRTARPQRRSETRSSRETRLGGPLQRRRGTPMDRRLGLMRTRHEEQADGVPTLEVDQQSAE